MADSKWEDAASMGREPVPARVGAPDEWAASGAPAGSSFDDQPDRESVSSNPPRGIAELAPPTGDRPTDAANTSRWRLGNWRLRWKLFVVLLVPLVTAAALGAIRVSGQLSSAAVYNQVNQRLALVGALSTVVDDLQREREQAALYAASNKAAGDGPNSPTTAAVDAAVAAFRQQLTATSGLPAAMQTSMNAAAHALSNDLIKLRSGISASAYPEMAVITDYSQLITTLLDATQASMVGSGADQRLYQNALQLDELRAAKDAYAEGNALLVVAAQENGFPPQGANLFQYTQTDYQALLVAFNSNSFNNVVGNATPDQTTIANTFTGPDVDERSQLAGLITGHVAGGRPIGVSPADVIKAGDGSVALLNTVEKNMFSQLQALTNTYGSDATRQAVRDGGLIALALLLAFLVTFWVARSLVLTLRRLRAGALDIARNRLPQNVQRILADPDPIAASSRAVEPIGVFTGDEVGQVARSFDLVHGQALRLAAEQAVLRDNVNAIFVNLSRRSQALVERQLALIDQLEKDEQDPDQLAHLFELDHLATRMRRNSESLLVLSGSGLAKRMSRAVPIGELVGAAVSEVEHYARVEVGSPPDVAVLGRAVNDLIHLIAELLDNATSFSQPTTKVSLRIARTKTKEIAIQITDRGVGMSDDDIQDINERLANPPEIDVGVTRRMGLYVVARLAQRHGIRVKLRPDEDIDGGTVALVVIPEEVTHRAGEDHAAPLPAGGKLASRGQSSTPAAGIASAFGAVARGRRDSAEGVLPEEPAGQLEPASSFFASDFTPVNAFSRNNPANQHGNGLAADDEPSPYEPHAGTVDGLAGANPAAESVSLWEPYTSVDADEPESEPFSFGSPFGSSPPERSAMDAPTERLPIYEAVLSQWFRAEPSAADEPASAEAAAEAPAAPPAPEPAAPPAPDESGLAADERGEPDLGGTERPSEVDDAADAAIQQEQPSQQEQSAAAKSGSALGALPTRVPGAALSVRGGPRSGADSAEAEPVEAEPAELTASAEGGSADDDHGREPAGGPATEIISAVPPSVANGTSGSTHEADPHGDADSQAPDHQHGETQVIAAVGGYAEEQDDGGYAGGWQTPADEGWQAAHALLNRPVADVTDAGLPRRVPKAHLVPGSARERSEAEEQQTQRVQLPPRSAEAIRGRMSSFQRGVRRGRHALTEAYSPGEASHSSQHRSDEEQE